MNTQKSVSFLLIIYALHSFLVGIGLIIIPVSWLGFFGFSDYCGHFFMTQAGIFHLIMAGIYCRAETLFPNSIELVKITIAVKSFAAVFLLTYYLFEAGLWLILLSGIVDGLMALVLYIFLSKTQSSR